MAHYNRTDARMAQARILVGEHAVKLRRDPPFMISGGIHGEAVEMLQTTCSKISRATMMQ